MKYLTIYSPLKIEFFRYLKYYGKLLVEPSDLTEIPLDSRSSFLLNSQPSEIIL